tara:strand:+ start:49 stop:729 length:681 start_codon:yes stop_codon:yes gene_type:complete
MRNFAIVPLRIGSKRVVNKNFRNLKGKPLWKWTVDTLQESDLFECIFLSSEDLNIFKIDDYKNIRFHKRKEELSQDNIHTIEVVFDVLENSEILIKDDDNIFLTLATSPFRKLETIKKTLKILEKGASSVIGIQKASKGSNSYRTFKKGTDVLNLPDKNLLHIQSSDRDEYIVTGSIFASKYNNLVKYKSFHQPESKGIIVGEDEAIDINTELDFFIASSYANNFL